MSRPTAEEQAAYDGLQEYTLGHGDPAFVHQHVVDAWAAQHAAADVKPIGVAFALAGLCLHLELGFSGRDVQRAHQGMASRPRRWPTFALPAERGSITAVEVLAASPGGARDRAIDDWCSSVWAAYAECHADVRDLLREHGLG